MEKKSPSILIVNTLDPQEENIISPSEESLIQIIGPEIRTRVISILEDINTDIPEEGVILNGSMFSVVDRPIWLDEYKSFINRMITENKFILGICFGSQLLGDIFGSNVQRSDKLSLGYRKINLNQEAKNHPMFFGIPSEIRVPSFHFDHIKYQPSSKTALGFSKDSYLYAFEVCMDGGNTAWGLQFHPEMTKERLLELLEANKDHFLDFESIKNEIINSAHPEFGAQIIRNCIRELIKKTMN